VIYIPQDLKWVVVEWRRQARIRRVERYRRERQQFLARVGGLDAFRAQRGRKESLQAGMVQYREWSLERGWQRWIKDSQVKVCVRVAREERHRQALKQWLAVCRAAHGYIEVRGCVVTVGMDRMQARAWQRWRGVCERESRMARIARVVAARGQVRARVRRLESVELGIVVEGRVSRLAAAVSPTNGSPTIPHPKCFPPPISGKGYEIPAGL
jgi:hypothetical protein